MADEMNAGFTPGPWRTVPHPDASCGAVGIIDVATFERDVEWDIGSPFGSAHTTCYLNPEANAALIAAAPDLYEALDKLMHELGEASDQGMEPAVPDSVYRTARDALAKARGESLSSS